MLDIPPTKNKRLSDVFHENFLITLFSLCFIKNQESDLQQVALWFRRAQSYFPVNFGFSSLGSK